MIATCLGLLCSRSTLCAQAIPIFVYHRFDPTLSGPTTVRTVTFESQLVWLENHHYQVVPLHSVIDRLRVNSGSNADLVVAITVDDGHRSVYTEMYPLILKHRTPVTLFIYPSAISNASYALTWQEIQKMQASGLVEVQSHTYWHPNFHKQRARLTDADYKAFVTGQLTRSKEVLERRLGVRVDALAWPFGIYDTYLEEAAQRAGYETAFAFEGGPAHAGCDTFAIPRIPVSEKDTGPSLARLLIDEKRIGKKE